MELFTCGIESKKFRQKNFRTRNNLDKTMHLFWRQVFFQFPVKINTHPGSIKITLSTCDHMMGIGFQETHHKDSLYSLVSEASTIIKYPIILFQSSVQNVFDYI